MNSNLEDAIHDLVRKLAESDNERAMGKVQLREVADLASFPTDLLHNYVTLSPALYNAGTRRFEFARTANRYPAGQIVFAGAGASSIKAAVSAGGLVALDLSPVDQTTWKILGGMLTSSAAVNAQVRQEQGTKSVTNLSLPVGVPVPFAAPGNGVQLDASKTLEIAVSLACTILFQFYVSEESDTLARGAV